MLTLTLTRMRGAYSFDRFCGHRMLPFSLFHFPGPGAGCKSSQSKAKALIIMKVHICNFYVPMQKPLNDVRLSSSRARAMVEFSSPGDQQRSVFNHSRSKSRADLWSLVLGLTRGCRFASRGLTRAFIFFILSIAVVFKMGDGCLDEAAAAVVDGATNHRMLYH